MINNQPLVTVFIPVYNAEMYIQESLSSIINQSYKNLEILIIDDGSTDNTINIIESFEDTRIRIIQNNVNKGLPYTRNLALDLAQGDYLAVMDADDIAFPNRIEKEIDKMLEKDDIAVVVSSCIIFGGKMRRISKPPKNDIEIRAGLLFSNRICNPTALINLNFLRKQKLKYNNNCFVAQDYEIWCQISKCGKFQVIEEPLLYYRYGHNNISKLSKSNLDKINQRNSILSLIHNDLIDYYKINLSNEEKRVFNLFYTDCPINTLAKSEVIILREVLNKIINKNLFNKRVLINVMDHSTIRHIYYQKLSLKEKILLYNSLIYNKFSLVMLFQLLKLLIKEITVGKVFAN